MLHKFLLTKYVKLKDLLLKDETQKIKYKHHWNLMSTLPLKPFWLEKHMGRYKEVNPLKELHNITPSVIIITKLQGIANVIIIISIKHFVRLLCKINIIVLMTAWAKKLLQLYKYLLYIWFIIYIGE